MSAVQRYLGLIPARGGSKGVPRKNLRTLGGRPLIGWTIDAARGSRRLDRTIVSTDDAEIAAVAEALGADVPFLRPAALATDEATALDVVRHALEQVPGYEVLVYLEPTSPFRSAADIDEAIEAFEQAGAPTCVTVRLATEIPDWMFYRAPDGRIEPLVPTGAAHRRQDARQSVVLNGCVYVAQIDRLLETGSFMGPGTVGVLMPADRSIDLDTLEDFAAAEAALAPARP